MSGGGCEAEGGDRTIPSMPQALVAGSEAAAQDGAAGFESQQAAVPSSTDNEAIRGRRLAGPMCAIHPRNVENTASSSSDDFNGRKNRLEARVRKQ